MRCVKNNSFLKTSSDRLDCFVFSSMYFECYRNHERAKRHSHYSIIRKTNVLRVFSTQPSTKEKRRGEQVIDCFVLFSTERELVKSGTRSLIES